MQQPYSAKNFYYLIKHFPIMKTRFTPWVVRTTLALLFLGGLINSSVTAQCGYSYQNMPFNLTVNMFGSTVVIDQTTLSPILGAAAGCNLYYEYPAGTLNPTETLNCSGIPGPIAITVRSDNDGVFDGVNTGPPITVNITLTDVSPPTVMCPPSVTIGTSSDMGYDCFGGNIDLTATISDNCTATSVYTIVNSNSGSVSTSTPTDGNAGDELFPVGINTVTYTVTDPSGNTASCAFTVTVNDNENPTWLPSEITDHPNILAQNYDAGTNTRSVVLDCNNPYYASTLDSLTTVYFPSAIDNCDPNVLVTMNPYGDSTLDCETRFGITNVYAIRGKTFSAVDNSGNSIDGNFTLIIYTSDHKGPDYADGGAIVPSGPAVEGPMGVYTAPALTLNISNFDPNQCGIDFTTPANDSLLLATAIDCQSVTYTGWSISAGGSTPIPSFPAGLGNNPAQFLAAGSYTITYNSEDPCGNASMYLLELTIVDDISPSISGCPSNITNVPSEAGNCYATVSWTRPTANDNCGPITNPTSSTYTDPHGNTYPLIIGLTTDYGVFPVGTSTIDYVFTDINSNTTTCEFTVTVIDVEAPTITCSGNQILNSICVNALVPDYTGLANVYDNCPNNGFTVTQIPPAGTLVSSLFMGPLVNGDVFAVSLKVVDAAGNPSPDPLGGSNECSFNVTLLDNDAPIPTLAVLPSIDPNNTTAASCPPYILFAPTASDCNGKLIYGQASIGGATYTAGPPPYYTLTPNNYVINWTYDDGNGNVATQIQTVQVILDAVAPVLDCPVNTVVNTDPGLCSATGIGGLQMIDVSPHVGGLMNYPGTLLNNQGIDNCDIVNFYYSVSGATTIAKTLGDNVGINTLSKGVNTVTYYGQDALGHEGTCTFTVTVNDNQVPTFTCAPSVLLQTGPTGNDAVQGDCKYTVGANDLSLDPTNINDNCGIASVTHTLLFKVPGSAGYTAGPSGSSLAGTVFTLSGTLLNSALYTIRWTVTDVNGNTSTCIQVIGVHDNVPPVITCKPNQNKTTSQDGILGDCVYQVNGAEFNATATDECDNSVFLTHDYAPAPSFTTLANAQFPVGTTVVTWTAVDNAFNTSTCSMTIIVTDDEKPTFTYCPSNVILPNTTGDCSNFVSWTRPNLVVPDVFDNCSSAAQINITETISNASVQAAISNNYPYNPHNIANTTVATTFPVGTTVITYVATDAMGNTKSCSFSVTIIDTEAPTVSNPGPQVLPSICANATVPNYVALVNVFDNCPNQLTVVQSPAAGTLISTIPGISNPPLDGQTFNVTITATNTNPFNLSGNTTFTVTLDDQQNPVPNIPGAALPPANSTCGSLTVTAPTANDCGQTIYGIPNTGMFIIGSNPPQYTFGIGGWNVLWTYIDPQNNTSVQSQLITVSADVTPPSIMCPMDLTVFTPSNGCTVVPSMTMTQVFNPMNVVKGTYYDLCGVVSVTYSLSGATTLAKKAGNNNNTITEAMNLGVTTVTYYVKDAAGNESNCTTTITVKDNIAPIISGVPANVVADCNNVPSQPGPGVVTASDNCTASPSLVLIETTTKGGNANLCSFYTYVITRTWIATDASNNVTQQTQTITVHDINAPTFNANFPADMTVNTDFDQCTKNLTLIVGSSMVSDNCAAFGNLTKSNSFNAGGANASGIYPIGVTNVIFTFTDPCGNSSSKSVKITVQDKQAPTPACVINVAVPIGANGVVTLNPNSFNAASFDNCTPSNQLQLALTPNVIDCSEVGQTINVVLTVTDAYGNSATCLTFVEVQDNVAPTITLCPADVTVTCNTSLDPYLNPFLGTPSVTDNCTTIVTFTDANTSPPPGACSAIKRTWKVADAFNNTNTCVQTIAVQDLTPPALVGLPADVTLACGSTIPSAPTVTATDFCDPNVSVSFAQSSTKTNNNTCTDYSYVVTRTWSAVDACGNTTVATRKITVLDNVAPVFSNISSPITLYTDNFNSLNCSAPVSLNLTSSNVTDCQPFANLTITNNSPYGGGGTNASGTYPVGSYTVVFTATDKCGNSSSTSVVITVIDNSKPTPKCDGNVNIGLNAAGNATITYLNVDQGSSDNCTAQNLLVFSLSKTFFDCSNFGPNLITMTVTDLAGNSNFCTSIINIQDNILPTIVCPSDVSVNCTSSLDPNVNLSLGKATATDNCTSSVIYTDASTSPSVGYCSALLRTWKVTDVAGNTASCIQKINILDNTPPTFTGTLPVDVTLTCGSTVPSAPTVTATDFCTPNVSVVLTETTTKTNNNSCSDYSYIVTRTWKATDNCGNTSTYTQKTTVLDNAGPVFSNMPGPITLSTESFNSQLCSAPLSLTLTNSNISDCEGFNNLTVTNNSPIGNGGLSASGTYPVGVYAIKFTATDKCGNSSMATVNVTVVDNSKPIAKCHDVVNVSVNNAGIGSVTAQNVDNGSIDNCTPSNQLILSLNITQFNCANIGNNLVVLTVIDQAGNSNVCTSIITVQDNLPPTISSCPADISVNCTSSLDPNVNLSLGKATASDNCSATVTYSDAITSPPAGFCSALIRTWKATDIGNNTATCTQKISIQDNTPPSFTNVFPPDVTLACGSTVPAAPNVTATDFCDPSVNISLNEFSNKTNNNSCTDFSYVVIRTWVATDDCGNSTTHTQKTTVLDVTPPVFTNVPGTITLFTDNFNSLVCSAPVTLLLNNTNVSDCEGFNNITVSNNSPYGSGGLNASGTYPVGTTVVKFTAIDKCGNTSTANVNVTVIDNSKPIAHCIALINLTLNNQGIATLAPQDVNNGSTDNCTPQNQLLLSLSQTQFDCTNLGSNIVTLTVTDQAGNSNTCTSIINIVSGSSTTLTLTFSTTNESAPGANDGSATAIVTGGSGSFSYKWNDPNNSTTQTVNGLAAGNYTVTVTDLVTGCKAVGTVTVNLNSSSSTFVISGNIMVPVTNANVGLVQVDMTGTTLATMTTTNSGNYSFTVPAFSNVVVKPLKNINPTNGVTALDMAIIQQHVTNPNTPTLTTPYMLIAGDMNHDGLINGIDLAVGQAVILGNLSSFPNNTSWVFVPKSYVFPNPLNPFTPPYPTSLMYTNLSGNQLNQNFWGIKIGDVQYSASPAQANGGNEVRDYVDELKFVTYDKALSKGATIHLDFTTENFNDILAYQYTMEADPEYLEIVETTSGVLPGMNKDFFGMNKSAEGSFTAVWYNNDGYNLYPKDNAFGLTLKVKKAGKKLSECLKLSDSQIITTAYNSNYKPIEIGLKFNSDVIVNPVHTFELYQNQPNPFKNTTTISFSLPNAERGNIQIMDLNGKVIKSIEKNFEKGINREDIQLENVSPGVFYYKVSTSTNSAIKKMVLID